MSIVLSTLRDFVMALAFSWLGVTLQAAEERAGVREAPRPASAATTPACPTTSGGSPVCAGRQAGYEADCAS